jgi:hypothetical protein
MKTLSAPRSRASTAWMQPTGPAPMIITVSPMLTSPLIWACTQEEMGSVMAAWTGSTPSGTRWMVPRRTASSGTAMYSAKPPGQAWAISR